MTRVITAVIGIPLVVYAIEFAPAILCVSIIFVAMLLALSEYFTLVREYVTFPFRCAGYLLATLPFACVVLELPVVLLPAGVILIMMVALFSRIDLVKAFHASVLSTFGALYVGGLMSYLAGIRMIDSGNQTGADLLLMLFCIIWAGDTFAYLVGKSMGRHKLAPSVSPRKTIEGAIAGLVFSVVAGVGCRYLFAQQISVFDAAILGILVGTLGQIGDLCESIVKRAMNVKDSGGLLPGHGGMLDRVDSLLFGAPALYYYFYFVMRA